VILRLAERLLLLLALAGYLGLASFVLLELDLPKTAVPMYLLAAAVALLLGARLAERRWSALSAASRLSLRWPVAGLAVALSLTAAQMADRISDTYWPPFVLWLGALALLTATAIGPILARHGGYRRTPIQWLQRHRWETAAVAFLAAAALALRLTNLTSIPWPLSGDEAAHALWARGLFWDRFSNVFQSGLQGQPNAFYLGLASSLKVVGFDIMGARFLATLFGAATVPVFYVFLRQAFDRETAFVGAAYLAAYHFHVHYSRMGLNNIGEPLVIALMLLFAWRAAVHGRPADFLLVGMVAGLSLYVSAGARIVALVLAAFMAFVALTKRGFLRANISNLGLMLAAYAAVGLPLGLFWLKHQDQFMDRLNAVGIFQSGWFGFQVEELGRSKIGVIWDQAKRSFGAFGYYKDRSLFYLAPIPLVDRVSLAPFVIGFLYALFHIRQERFVLLLLVFLGTVVTGGVLTIEPPMSQRLLPVVPAVCAFVAVGLVVICRTILRARPGFTRYALGIGIAILVAVNIQFYFFDYTGGLYRKDDPAEVALLLQPYAKELPQGLLIYFYGGPVHSVGFPSFRFLMPNIKMVDVVQGGGPSADTSDHRGPTLFVFLPHREGELAAVQQQCPGGEVRTFSDSERKLFTSYAVLTGTCAPFAQVAR
jgi:4-amino-4-deoxy-L-arabinose transferase-like glycosyltransferase